MRRVCDHYKIPPWELDDVTADDVIAEAEVIDVREEMARIENG